MDYFPDNTLTHFTTRLPQMMDLDGSWEIGLSEIQYPHSWNDIKKGEAWVQVDVLFEVNQLQRHTFELQAGYYPSPKRVLKAIEEKKHKTPLRKNFDIRMNEIEHKIGIAVKKDCQMTISSLLQHLLGFKRAILGGRRQQGIKLSVRVLPTGRTENGGRRSSTTIENRTGRKKRHRDGDQSFRSRAVLSSGIKTFSNR